MNADRSPATDEFEVVILRALREEAYSAPLLLDVARIEDRARVRRSFLQALRVRPMLASAVVIGAILLAVLAAPGLPALFGTPAYADCDTSPVTRHGSWWEEIGGERAFFNAEPTAMSAGSAHSWLIHVRFDPDAGTGQGVSMWADNLESGERVDALLGDRVDRTNLFRFDQPAPDLPGGWYLFQQSFPTAGCWRLAAAINGQVVGSAVVLVADPPADTPMSLADSAPAAWRSSQADSRSLIGVVRAPQQAQVENRRTNLTASFLFGLPTDVIVTSRTALSPLTASDRRVT